MIQFLAYIRFSCKIGKSYLSMWPNKQFIRRQSNNSLLLLNHWASLNEVKCSLSDKGEWRQLQLIIHYQTPTFSHFTLSHRRVKNLFLPVIPYLLPWNQRFCLNFLWKCGRSVWRPCSPFPWFWCLSKAETLYKRLETSHAPAPLIMRNQFVARMGGPAGMRIVWNAVHRVSSQGDKYNLF